MLEKIIKAIEKDLALGFELGVVVTREEAREIVDYYRRAESKKDYCTCPDSYRIEERCVEICGDCKKPLRGE